MRRMGGWADGRVVPWLFALLLLATPALAFGQVSADPPVRPSAADSITVRRGVPPLVRYGKWVALGGAFALGLRANALHQDANDSYRTLQDRCFQVALSCTLLPDGRYIDPVNERLYSETRDRDHQAGRYLVGAEVSFALAAVGFVWELLKRKDRTPNIPFEPRVETTARETRVGVAVRF